jgi:hypothetical protein
MSLVSPIFNTWTSLRPRRARPTARIDLAKVMRDRPREQRRFVPSFDVEGGVGMRWLSMLVAALGLVLSGAALAVPNADAEQAYARGDYATAFKIWFQLAEQGSVQAQLNVARMYERGEWVAQDSRAAQEWYNRAAAQGARDAAMPGVPGAPVVAGAVPGSTQPGNVPVAYPRTVYFPSPPPVYDPGPRPVFAPVFRVHRRHH